MAEQYHLKTCSDLVPVSHQIILGVEQEFLGRFKDVKAMDPGPRYRAVAQGNAQVMDAFATDRQLKAFHMVILEDDKHFEQAAEA